jgi:FkbM family methyltransferase
VTTALTSLPPGRTDSDVIRGCIRSWRAAGLDVVAFNHPSEIPRLREQYDVRFVPVTETTMALFGRHCVPVSAMLHWAAKRDAPALLINSDIELDLAPWELERIRLRSADGLGYLVRHNHTGECPGAVREPIGIDAILVNGRDVAELPDSFLSLGQPFWDFWLPHAFVSRGRRLYSADFPAAFHLGHPTQWSWETWQRCATEFARVSGQHCATETQDACHALSSRVRARIESATTPIDRHPQAIRAWVESRFQDSGPKLFLELGAHRGADTAWLAGVPDVTLHAFEPDPRNVQPRGTNATVHRAAVCDRDGRGQLILSREGWGREWTYSSSLRRPKNHLQRFPVTFGDAVEVELVALDTFYREHGLELVDFVWADVQGAEADVVRGGLAALRNTRYLYTEYSDDELYEGQATLAEILALLPDFRVLELWPEDVLLENRRLAA